MTTGKGARSSGQGAVERCRCSKCGAQYGRLAFEDLVPVKTLGESDLSDYVVRWPDGIVIDVRTCSRCSAPIARLTQRAS
jgi:hypothetical protein